LPLILLFLAFQSVPVEIYERVDDKGTIHLTKDPSTIPEKYRDGVKNRSVEPDKKEG
jgi:hypothetical protein